MVTRRKRESCASGHAREIGTGGLTGGYRLWKTLGPPHISFTDRGLTMATRSREGVCMELVEPVRGARPTSRLRHPGLTVTVADCRGLIEAIR